MTRVLIKMAVGVISFWASYALAADSGALSNKTDRLSYALGVTTGKSFKRNDINLDANAFSRGLQDALNGNPLLLTNDQINQEMRDFQKTASTKVQAQMQQSGQKNEQLANAFLEANKERSGVTTTPSGLQYKVIVQGAGAKPTLNDVVTVDYEGRLLDGKVFDSSYERGTPATFPVNGVISGWQEALQLMPIGSTWEIYIPAKLAYARNGVPGVIGPNETLIFKVHLVKVQKNQNQ